jgi:TonB-dependent SusC/RagA subfamily outer membrane receptor
MITAWMLYSLLVGALVSVGALIIDRAARAANLPRRFTWAGALGFLIALTALAPWRAESVQPNTSGTITSAVDVSPLLIAAPQTFAERAIEVLRFPIDQGIDGMVALVPLPFDRAVGALWLLATIGTLVSVLHMMRKLDRSRRLWPMATMFGHRVRVAKTQGPAVYGVLQPDIVLPSTLLTQAPEDQLLVLAHEHEHRRARDPLLLSATALAVALVPWHPLAWWMASRLRLAIEVDCDARVLRSGASPRRYAELLLTLATHMPSRRSALHALALLDSRRHLERRLLAMTTRPSRRTPVAVGAFLLACSGMVFAACNTDVPTAAQIRDADATSVVQALGLPAGDAIAYTVDEQPVSAAEAKLVKAEDIATINVVGRSAGKRADEVRIVTRKYAESQLDAQVADSVRGTLMQVAVDTSLLARMDSASRLGRMDSVRARVGVRDTTAIVSMALMRDSSAGNTIVRRSGERLPYTVQCSGDECNPSGDSVRTRMSGSRVILRADSSASASQAQPLFIIDGVISTRGLAHLNPDNIESIEVVKGNAAERFYGPRAANGVINITTKRP